MAHAGVLGAGARVRSGATSGGVARQATLERDDVFLTPRPGADEAALIAALAARGIAAHGSGARLWARLPRHQLGALAALPELARVELAPPMRPLLDMSALEIGATAVHAGERLKHKRTGAGVLVGVLDTGIDLQHPAFLGADGRSRVIAVWDQDGDGRGPRGFDYGVECDRSSILAGTCEVNDPQGHGTHVAGILAGALAPHRGIAPDAEIVVVKSTRFTDVAGAVEWMFRVAEREGKPIVVNLSIGGHLGPHDGQSDLERSLERLQGPGKIVVAAAGNDGATPIHLRGIADDRAHRAELLMPDAGAPTLTMLEIWEDGSNGVSFFIELRDRRGALLSRVDLVDGFEHSVSGPTETVGGQLGKRDASQPYGRVAYANEVPQGSARTHHVIAVDRSVNEDDNGARWTLGWRATHTFDAWISTDDYRYGSAEFAVTGGDAIDGFVAGDSNMTLTIPGTARGVITVGSYVTKNQWQNEAGRVYRISKAELAQLSSFSSIGPTAAPDITGEKPDLIAPGQLIAGPLATGASAASSPLAIDGHFAVMQGTSMSAPHVAGTVALMLEANPRLAPDEAKAVLVETATVDAMLEAQLPNDKSGFGRLNAHNALARIEGSARASGCNALGSAGGDTNGSHNGEEMVFVAMAMTLVVGQMMLQRRMRLYRLRALQAQS